MVVSGPMVTYTSAQAATDAKIAEIKKKALKEIDRRIESLNKTKAQLEKQIKLENESIDNAMRILGLTQEDIDTKFKTVALDSGIKTKSLEATKAVTVKLQDLRKEVEAAKTLDDIQRLAKVVDSQYKVDLAAHLQGAVTKAIEGFTGVFDKIKSAFNDAQSRVSKLKECTQSTDNTIPSCGNQRYSVEDADIAKNTQSQMDNIATMLSTVGTVLMSAIMLVATLVTSFSGLLGGLGDLSSLGDVSNLSSLGSLSGLTSSFTSILSQLDIVSGMGGNISTLLGGVTGMLSAFKF